MAFFRLSKKSDRFSQNHTTDNSSPKRKRKTLRSSKISMDRQSKVETLERRELLAAEILNADIVPHGLFAEGTPQSIIDAWEAKAHANQAGHHDLDGPQPILSGTRWRTSALGTSPDEGDPIGLTWSIVPDGTDIIDPQTGGVEGTSNLVGFLDNIYGGAAIDVIANKPWFELFERVYDSWADTTGLSFQYEPFDDGAPMAAGPSVGVLGVRGDMRVSGRAIDGPGNVLAFNYIPSNGGNGGADGDMVVDTSDTFYARNSDGPTGRNTGLHNVLAHEVGHGLGFLHVVPVNGTKLMEPIINLGFYGPQEDDLYNAHALYGDRLESNNSIDQPFDLGPLRNEVAEFTDLSISNNLDVDVFRFDVAIPTFISGSVQPTGTEYLEEGQFGDPASTLVNRAAESDLGIRVLDADGNVLQAINNTGLGSPESLPEVELATAGTYFVEVFGAGDTQLYDLALRVGRPFGFDPQSGDLRLISVNPSAEDLFSPDDVNVLQTSPSELTLRFTSDSAIDEASLAGGIRISGAGADQLRGTPDDVVITPGWIGFGENEQTIVARFAEPLADSRYRIEVFGADIESEGVTALRESDGGLFVPRVNGTDRDAIDFELELGARVISVVPQPVTRNSAGVLTPQRETIHVYFDDNDLFASFDPADPGTDSLVNPAFYQLIRTEDSVENTDDQLHLPISVRAVEFETQTVPDPVNPGATIDVQVRVNRVELTFLDDLDDLTGGGAYRLKIGSSEPVTVAGDPDDIATQSELADIGELASTAEVLNFAGGTTVIASGEIVSDGLPFDFPGASPLEPGHRNIAEERHLNAIDETGRLTTHYYNFALNRPFLVTDGVEYFTSINPQQMQRARESFALWGRRTGIQFVETDSAVPPDGSSPNTTFVVGDFAAVGSVSEPGGTIGLGGPAQVTMDAAETWFDGYGPSTGLGQSFFITALHEIGHAIGLGHAYELQPSTVMGGADFFPRDTETNFPGVIDRLHANVIHRPDNRDVDMYRFNVPDGVGGTIDIEAFAQRTTGGSLLDTHIALFRDDGGTITRIAANNDSFGTDSALRLELGSGDYLIGVTANGNQDYDPQQPGSGTGGDSEGSYDLRVSFRETETSTIRDAAGTAFDGDADGTPGGAFNYFFRVAAESDTLYVDASAADPPAGTAGSALTPFNEIDQAIAAATPGQTVRIVGNAGADGIIGLEQDNFSAAADNFAYEIGRIDSINTTLDDGRNLIVPAGVNVVIDAGAILKMFNSRIAVGSVPGGVDASGGSLQVLGVPHLPVFITSHNDTSIGLEDGNLGLAPSPGDYGGIDIRSGIDRAEGRFDAEREGLFLNNIFQTDIRYGGAVVPINGQLVAVDPIRLDSARPTLIGNRITRNSGAAVSADPASFEETRFTGLRSQRDASFVPDYDRVGPVIYGQHMVDNSVNGLLIRIDTAAGSTPEELLVSARFDDTEIVHVLGDNLLIRGNPAGAMTQSPATAPVLTNLSAVSVAGVSGLAAGSYQYHISFVDDNGFETPPSLPTTSVTVVDGQSVQLNGLPVATGDFSSRRLYRVNPNGSVGLVAELDRSDTTHVDSSADIGTAPLTLSPEAVRTRLDARLQVDPGVTIKSDDVRIELGFGADLIAEGTDVRPVVFTSRSDDRYGAGGTFDTTGNGETSGAPGQWAGIYARPDASLSIDQAVIAYAGGTSTVEQTTASFNAIEIRQADARIAHTLFESNAGGDSESNNNRNRGTRLENSSAVIYVAGAQPIIVENTFVGTVSAGGNSTAAIDINTNALTDTPLNDLGRQTGDIDLVEHPINVGPLIRGNRLAEGITYTAGLHIRPEIVATGVVFDDTDITHVVSGSIVDPNLHTFGGLQLRSRGGESLVVKFDTTDGSLQADGAPLEIEDRIGGTLQVLGQPGFPVVLTSIHDDSVGAGLTPDGLSLTNTGGDSDPIAGDYEGLLISHFANDRNVAAIVENESSGGAEGDPNSNPDRAQSLGRLASGEKSSDENLRLGFVVDGAIQFPGDQDVYSFVGTAGTTVWLDIDRTDETLDSVIEIIDASGNVLAASDNSTEEIADGAISNPGSIGGLTLSQDPLTPRHSINDAYRDLYTLNTLDAGMRVQLPGAAGSAEQYFVRVSGANGSFGIYELQVRLRELDEFAGSTVRYADIRYASTGINLEGGPAHSPLVGELRDNGNDATVDLGSLATTERAVISIAGELEDAIDERTYQFSISRAGLQTGTTTASGITEPGDYIATTFDIDYADGLGRPDTTILLYSRDVEANTRTLIAVANDSNISSDRRDTTESGSDLDDLSRGSVGSRDGFLGSMELLAGDYEVVVTGNAQVPTQLLQSLIPSPTNPNIRLEPLGNIARIAEDRFDGPGGDNDDIPRNTVDTTGFLGNSPVQVVLQGEENAIPFSLGDVTLFVIEGSRPNNSARVGSIDPQVGVRDALYTTDQNPLGDIAQSPDGFVYASSAGTRNTENVNDANAGNFFRLNEDGQTVESVGNTGLLTFEGFVNNGNNAVGRQQSVAGGRIGNGHVMSALTYQVSGANRQNLALFGVSSLGNGRDTYTSVTVGGANGNVNGLVPDTPATNFLWRLNPETGAAISAAPGGQERQGDSRAQGAGTAQIEIGRIETSPGAIVTGIADVDGTLFAVTTLGELISIAGITHNTNNPGAGNTPASNRNLPENLIGAPVATIIDPVTDQPVVFTSLDAGPRNITDPTSGLPLSNFLFATDDAGQMYVFDTSGVLQPLLQRGLSQQQTQAVDPVGIAFSNLDVNLFHRTVERGGDAGHGAPATHDQTRMDAEAGQTSLFFGYELPGGPDDNTQLGDWEGQFASDRALKPIPNMPNNRRPSYDFAGGAHGNIESFGFDLADYGADDEPTLYFNYFLDTEDAEGNINGGQSRDSVRVFVASEERQTWTLVATNNSRNAGTLADTGGGNFDEFDRGESRYTQDENGEGEAYQTRELFDAAQWRQARVPLQPWAGDNDVRIRIEFNSAGESERNVAELRAVDARVLLEGIAGAEPNRSFMITEDDLAGTFGGATTTTFEFDFGLVLRTAAGSSITNGDSFTLAPTNGAAPTTFTFLQLDGSSPVSFDALDTAADVGVELVAAIEAAGLTVTPDAVDPEFLDITDADGNVVTVASNNAAIIDGVRVELIDGASLASGDTLTLTVADPEIDPITLVFASSTDIPYEATDTAGAVAASAATVLENAGYTSVIDSSNTSRIQITASDALAVTTAVGNDTTIASSVADLTDGTIITPVPGTDLIEGDTLEITDSVSLETTTFVFRDNDVLAVEFDGATIADTVDDAETVAANLVGGFVAGDLLAEVDLVDASVFGFVDADGNSVQVALASNNLSAVQSLISVSDAAQLSEGDLLTLTPSLGGAPIVFRYTDTANLNVVFDPAGTDADAVSDLVDAINLQIPGAATIGTGDGTTVVISDPAVDDFQLVDPTGVLLTDVLTLGDGASIANGDTFTLNSVAGPTTFTFRDVAPDPLLDTDIVYDPASGAGAVATAVSDAINAAGFTATANAVSASSITVVDGDGNPVFLDAETTTVNLGGFLLNAVPVGGEEITLSSGAGDQTLVFQPGTEILIPFTVGDDAATIAAATAAAIDATVELSASVDLGDANRVELSDADGTLISAVASDNVLLTTSFRAVDGAGLVDGDTITVTLPPVVPADPDLPPVPAPLPVTIVLRDTDINSVFFNATDTSGEVGVAIGQALLAAGFTMTVAASENALTPTEVSLISGGVAVVDAFGVDPSSVRIPIGINDVATDVQLAMQMAIADEFTADDAVANLNQFPLARQSVRLFGFTINDPGSLGYFQNPTNIIPAAEPDTDNPLTGLFVDAITGLPVATPHPGLDSGVYPELNETGFGNSLADSLRTSGRRASNNTSEGFYLDDLIIGFAERGELVHDATPGNQLSLNPLHEQEINIGGRVTDLPDQGAFQLEVRLSVDTVAPIGGTDSERIRNFDTNDIIGRGLSFDFVRTNGADISDGAVITLSDGNDIARFEFDNLDDGVGSGVATGAIPVSFTSDMTSIEIATVVRDAINSPAAQSILDITAFSPDGSTTTGVGTSDTFLLSGLVSSDLTGGLDFAPAIPTLFSFVFGTEFENAGTATGDENRFRDQGQIIIENTFISSSSSFGIESTFERANQADTPLDIGATQPLPGATRAFPTPNPQNLVPGPVLRNNVLFNNTGGGIRVSGDTSNGNLPAAAPFVRVINNTIVDNGFGIAISTGAAPTLLNNAVVGNTVGIFADNSVNAAEIFNTLYGDNGTNVFGVGLGGVPQIAGGDQVFVDRTGDNFYPSIGSQLIDNGNAAQGDRLGLRTLRGSLGIAESPILAPATDITGFTRADDGDPATGGGVGSSVFIDIGAFDRVDRVGPSARLITPLDNDALGADQDGLPTIVQLSSGTLDEFVIRLEDIRGAGIDDSTVGPDRITVTQDGRVLASGVDYTFAYSATDNTIILTPTSGIWTPGSAYEITLSNRDRTGLQLQSGDQIDDGETFSIIDNDGTEVEFEFDGGLAFRFNDVANDGDIIRFTSGPTIQIEFDIDGDLDPATTDVIAIDPADNAESLSVKLANLLRNGDFGFDTAVSLNGDLASITFDPDVDAEVVSTTVEVASRAGVADGSVAVPYLPTADFSAESTAGSLIAAISNSDLNASAFTPGGGQVFVDNVASVTNLVSADVGAIVDLAGNDLQANRVNRETQFTILLPGTQLDFGDADTSFPTLVADNGARHTIAAGAPRFGTFIDSELNSRRLNGGTDDAGLVVVGNGTGGLTVTTIDDGIELVVDTTVRPGDTVTIDLGGGELRVFELVLAGNAPTNPANVPVLLVPNSVGVSASALAVRTAERLASVITENLSQSVGGALPPATSVQYVRETERLQVVSVDDEDGVLIFGSGSFAGMFIDPEFDSMGGTVAASEEVLNFLNPNATNGVFLALDVQGNGLVDAWIDFNDDDDFDDVGEQVLFNQPVIDGDSNRVQIITPANVSLPSGGSKEVAARFRISSTGNQTPDGLTIGGEVEDYTVTIIDAPLPQAVSASYTINEDNIGNDPLDTTAFPLQYPPLTTDTSAFTNVRYVVARDTTFGTLNLTDTGEFTYQPREDFFGTDTFTYQVIGNVNVDGTILPVRSELATVAITVNPVNDAPSALVQVIQGIEDQDLSFTADDLLDGALPQDDADVRISPFDEQEQTLSVININVLDETGVMVPVLDLTDPTDPFSISEGSVQREVYIEVTAGVFEPFGTLTVDVATDSVTGVTEVSELTFAPEIQVDSGELDVDGNPIFDVVRLDNYNRTSPAPVPFEYVVADNGQTTLPDGTDATESVTPEIITQTATIELLERNDAPVAGNDVIIAVEDPVGGFVIDHAMILGNDTAGAKADAEGRNASIDENNGTTDITLSMPVLIDNPAFASPDPTVSVFTSGFGVVSYNPADPTQFIYTPRPDFYGIDSFVYSITDNGNNVSLDGSGAEINTPSMLTTTATVVLDVRPQNDAPFTPNKPTAAQALTGVFTTTEDPATPLIITANSLTEGSFGHAAPAFFGAPQNESNQTFFVSGVFDKDDNEITIAEVGDPADPDTFESPSGTFRPFFNATAGPLFGHLIRVEYTPADDFNSAQDLGAGLVSVPDTFAFTLSDDGISIDQRPSVDLNGNPFGDYPIEPASIKATVAITVTPVNDAPALGDDTVDAVEDVQLLIPFATISANDSVGPADEVDGTNDGVLTYSQSPITTTAGGIVNFLANGDLSYTPPAEFSGEDTFVYSATDQGVTVGGDGNRASDPRSSTGTVTVNVAALNDPPTIDQIEDLTLLEGEVGRVATISGISAGGGENQMLRVTATSSAPSPFDALTPVYTSPNEVATIPLTPRPFESGTTVVTVTVTDAGFDGIFDTADDASTSLDINVNVLEVNDAPTIDAIDDFSVTENDTVLPVDLTGISAGPQETQPLAITVTSSNQSLVRNEDIVVDYTDPDTTGSFTYSLLPDRAGTTTLTVTLTDGGLDGDLATAGDNGVTTETITLSVINIVNIPEPADDAFDSDEDLAVIIDSDQLTDNDFAPDLAPGESLSVILDADNPDDATQTITTTLGATVTLNTATGELTYDPVTATQLQALAPGEFVEDSFTYFVNDGTLSAPLPSATVRMSIEGINDAPTVVDDVIGSPPLPANPSTLAPLLVRPLANDSDVDGTLDINSLIVTEEPLFGSVSRRLVDDGNGNQVVELAYSPFVQFAGTDSFKYTVSDDLGQQSVEATIEIRPSMAPVTGPDIGGGVAADGITINVLANDVPVVGSLDLSSLMISRAANNGVATANSDGTVGYVPNPGFVGTDSFQYTVADSEGNVSEPVTVVVNATANGMQNPVRFADVDANGRVEAFDALLIINRLDRASSNRVPVDSADRGPNFFDVNGSGDITAFDALMVINNIGRPAPIFEGESIQEPTLVAPSTSLPSVALPNQSDDRLDAPVGLAIDPGLQVSKQVSTDSVAPGQNTPSGDVVDDSLVDLLAQDAGSEAFDEISEESATDLAFKLLR
ncbi:Matrixin [Rubripirellula obstinata]|uniref:Matrixin n=1 Tax=Rubripirellula obstinata TaxID=406547 RepID=A0A5B1CH38_9BACT|nr:tandem-95 repeat protein [Rubripirellula obstinata]KAA1258524.1 Matrixin [Rubripirellula obstinata]